MNILYFLIFSVVLMVVGITLVYIFLFLEKTFKKPYKIINKQDNQFYNEIINESVLHRKNSVIPLAKTEFEEIELIDSNYNKKQKTTEKNDLVPDIFISEFNKIKHIKFPTPLINTWKQKNTFNYYAIYDYYPREEYETVPHEVDDIRISIDNFKNGYFNHTIKASEIVAEVINSDIIKNKIFNLNEYVLAIIPASTEHKTRKRFYNFCNIVTNLTKICNGYSCITLNKERMNLSGTINLNKTDNLNYDVNIIANKKIILIDDIITTGDSFIQNAQKLMLYNAKSVTGIFFGETYDANRGIPFWMDTDIIRKPIEIKKYRINLEDLPF